MSGKILMAALLTFGACTFAADEGNVNVTVKGTLHEDKYGFFVQADGQTFDLNFNEAGKADMHKFYADLKGDPVKVSGALVIGEVTNGKPRLIVYSNDVSRIKGDGGVVTERRVIEQPVIVRENYVEHHGGGIHLPGIHINW